LGRPHAQYPALTYDGQAAAERNYKMVPAMSGASLFI